MKKRKHRKKIEEEYNCADYDCEPEIDYYDIEEYDIPDYYEDYELRFEDNEDW